MGEIIKSELKRWISFKKNKSNKYKKFAYIKLFKYQINILLNLS